MTKTLGIDQSLSKTAMVLLEDNIPVEHKLSRTGKMSVKVRKKGVIYYATLPEQIQYICRDMLDFVREHNPDHIVFEALSFGSNGSASRDLACLAGAMKYALLEEGYLGKISETAPTSLKSHAHKYLPYESAYEGKTIAGKDKKCKMDKKKVVEAVREIYGQDYLSGYNYSTGLDDLADATFLAHKYWSENCVDGKDVQDQ